MITLTMKIQMPIKMNLSIPCGGRNLTGERFGMLQVISYSGTYFQPNGNAVSYWSCKCDCGTKRNVRGSQMVRGSAQSCGCQRMKSNFKHGFASNGKREKIYTVWEAMIDRCRNPNHHAFHNYGGRGITVCDAWKNFLSFKDDMIADYKEGLTLERRDNSLGYSKANCLWASKRDQARNRRTSIMVEINGETMCVTEWCERFQIHRERVYYAIRNGDSCVDAILRLTGNRENLNREANG